LTRAQDRISYLYVERSMINRQDNAITIVSKRGTAHVPATAIGSLLVGPGVSMTHQAMVLLGDSGTSVLWVGAGGVRLYAHGRSLATTTTLLEQQARLVSNQRTRLDVARAMYAMRFPNEDVSRLTMSQLRGREGVRVQRLYRDHARRVDIEWDGRRYVRNDWGSTDPLNQALSAANACLYGAVHSVIVSLGCSAGLGFVHTGHDKSFVYDVADLYKAATSIPTAFDVAATTDSLEIAGAARRAVRERMWDLRLMRQCVRDIKSLLQAPDDDPELVVMSLWDDKAGTVPSGVAYRDPNSEEAREFSEWEATW